ncbi:MAG: tetratricopeptide repeat protein [Desulfobacterales bacterium]|nr:MAG: tetratricopeptide repeat protein [Desulfobacterales bacterium]
MAKKAKNDSAQYVRKETFWLGTLLALAVGFFGGVMFAVFKSDTAPVPGPTPAQAPQAQVGQPDRSRMIAALENETAKNPLKVEAWIQLGNEYFDSDQFEKSIQAYQKALELDPANANVWTDMGIMYRRSGNPQKAIECFDKAIATDPKHEPSRLNKGIVLLHDLKDFDGAIKAWEELLEVNPIAMAPTGRSVDEMVQQMKKQANEMGQGTGN